MTTEERGKQAFDLHTKVVNNEKARRYLLAENAKLLTEMLEGRYYKDILGDEEGEWAGYLGQLEIFYSRNEINTYIRVYKKLTGELKIDPTIWVDVPITRLTEILPIVNIENYVNWFSSALLMTKKDWNIILNQAKGKEVEGDGHTCDDVNYDICRLCGRRHKTHDTKATSKSDSG